MEWINYREKLGIKYDWPLQRGNYYEEVEDEFEECNDSLEDFLSCYIAFINCKEEYTFIAEDGDVTKKEDYLKILEQELCKAHIQYELIRDNEGYFVFPKGIEKFDQALISEPLSWLSKYPNAEKAWSKAVTDYANADEGNASNVADGFRKALEIFFHSFFGGNKNFKNYKNEYGDYLKQHGVPIEISKNYMLLIQQFDDFNNNYAKHRDATSVKLLEYLMYQTGMLMRLLITI